MSQAGFQIGSYSVLSRLGAGGMGEVWLATRAGRQCVVKTLLPHLAEDTRVREMFLKEGRVASMISDTNVVRIYELGTAGGQIYMALEYVDGTSLDRLLMSRRKLPPVIAGYVAARAAAGLQAIHEQRHPETNEPLKIVHRDISPSNLLLSVTGDVKVADFGIAKTFTTDPGGQTTHGTAKGKIAYMSPEQARGRIVDGRSDVFALGVVLYELLVGDIPYQRIRNDYEMLAQVVHGRGRPLRAAAPEVPQPLADIVDRALVIDAEKRWPSARAMRTALEAWLRQQSTFPEAPAELGALVAVARGAAKKPTGRQETKGVEVAQVSPSMIIPAHTPKTVNVRSPVEAMPDAVPEQEQPAPEAATPFAQQVATVPMPAVRRRRPLIPFVAAGLGLLAVISIAWGVSGTGDPATPVVPAPPAKVSPAPQEPKRAAAPPPAPSLPSEPAPVEEPSPGAQTQRQPWRKPVAARKQQQQQQPAIAKPPEKTVALESVPSADVWAGDTLLGHTPLEVPAGVGTVRLVSQADGVDFSVKVVDGDEPQKVVVPRASLHVRVDPWAEVTLDGRALGMTPVPPLSVYAGKHVIDLVNDERKIRRRVEVELAGGETKVVREKL